ncbi:MAG: hypothetical protein JWM16_1004 [Verrucomicrobiales bacterium]|nr:hypothetical protein [Verrucomicrobiales bacterium]
MNAQLNSGDKESSGWLNLVRAQVDSMNFGVVQIVVHENRVVQIERTEKVRLDKSNSLMAANWKTRGQNNT